MTTERLVRILLRRWYVVGLGLAITVLGMQQVRAQQGVFFSQVDVVFTAPPTRVAPNTIQANASGLVSIAGMVAAEVNKASNTPVTASAGATLAGQGVRDGYQVRLPSDGGQWSRNFDRPVLDVQAIGAEPEMVRQRVVTVVAEIDRVLAELQNADGIPAEDQVKTLSAPTSAQIFYRKGNTSRATAVTALLGFWLTVVLTVAADSVLVRRRRARVAVRRVDRVPVGAR
ncbi:hypothetical protein GCM10009798_32530 [Nocardioides panacihumi]|uniref:Polysaccharide chain length determinant N-terminal domain-containing protein n=1 Tax=Nocardioides panacihumi TaxID=400774 RepID=A0ABP5CV46_9ACTN